LDRKYRKNVYSSLGSLTRIAITQQTEQSHKTNKQNPNADFIG